MLRHYSPAKLQYLNYKFGLIASIYELDRCLHRCLHQRVDCLNHGILDKQHLALTAQQLCPRMGYNHQNQMSCLLWHPENAE